MVIVRGINRVDIVMDLIARRMWISRKRKGPCALERGCARKPRSRVIGTNQRLNREERSRHYSRKERLRRTQYLPKYHTRQMRQGTLNPRRE